MRSIWRNNRGTSGTGHLRLSGYRDLKLAIDNIPDLIGRRTPAKLGDRASAQRGPAPSPKILLEQIRAIARAEDSNATAEVRRSLVRD